MSPAKNSFFWLSPKLTSAFRLEITKKSDNKVPS